MTGPLLDFFRAARSAGLRLSPAESIDAVQAAEVIGFADREALRDALGLVLAKTVEEKQVFATCFDLFFAAPAPPAPPPDEAPAAGEGESPLGRMILSGDAAGLAAAAAAAAAEADVTSIAIFTQVNLFTRRILERMGLAALDREIAAAPPVTAQRLREGREGLRETVRDEVQRNLALYAEGRNEEFRRRTLARTRLAAIDRRDHERMRQLVRAMARRLASLYGRKRRRDRRGVLDVRRTLRRNMAWDGVPFLPVWKQEVIARPKLILLCDVSGSVAAMAQFLLLFAYSLREALAGLRAFAFTGTMVEVSDLLEDLPIERAIPAVLDRAGFGSSNYGAALADFEAGFMGLLDHQTTVIILGDGRGNRTDPRSDILARMAERAKQIVWLNPETRTLWGTGDSDMPRYAPHCRIAAHCSTLDGLERIISGLLRDGA
ncbi:VWA domain-containing protein [Belnapia sp. T6]|uniref:VWA domain-containing protein n=1 Tax=Belnapia mucosa TaxID=2804532 RepID=A0ABS1UZ23_9PROT|nr:VWA domain-containing protein [Belnapia mucosa]MBL6454712.1 VWA domain-containing protein [Belnapia mucosa]